MLELAPKITAWDPVNSAEGGLDPLGLYAIADALAVKLVPGVRQRMSRPRYLTAMAVSSAVCQDLQEDESLQEREVEPYLIFEMYAVEGLVRAFPKLSDLPHLAGREKATAALKEGVHLSLKRYLKTPTVFGFHGIYRVLAKDLDITEDGLLGEKGYRLLHIWMEEQRLDGFYGKSGPGASLRMQLADAVRDGLASAGVVRTGGWTGWSFFAEHLASNQIGKREASFVYDELASHDYRRAVMEYVKSAEGTALWNETGSERSIHSELLRFSAGAMRELLQTTMKYESFARILMDAFYECLSHMTDRKEIRTPPSELAGTRGIREACNKIPDLFIELSDRLSPFGETARFESSFQELGLRTSPVEWAMLLLDHHRRIQKEKPPNGKNPWFETFDDGSVAIRPRYRQSQGGRFDDSYVHQYRIGPLFSFLTDLGHIKS